MFVTFVVLKAVAAGCGRRKGRFVGRSCGGLVCVSAAAIDCHKIYSKLAMSSHNSSDNNNRRA